MAKFDGKKVEGGKFGGKSVKKDESKLIDELKVTSARPLELTLRSGVEGGAELLDMVSGPIKAGLNQIPGFNYQTDTYSQAASNLLDKAKFWSDSPAIARPESRGEKIVGTGTKMLAGLSPFVKGGQVLVQSSKPVAQGIGSILSQTPGLQAATAISAGSGGEAAKQGGAGPVGQFGAALISGLAPMSAMNAANAFRHVLPPSTPQVNNALKGVNLKGLSTAAVNRIRKKVDEALRFGELDDAALKRMIDFERTGTIPTKASLTLDPIDKTQQMNLSKIGAQSSNANLQQLSRVQNTNNQTLLGNLDELAGNQGYDPYVGGQAAIGPVTAKRQSLINEQQSLYNAARDEIGRSLPLNRSDFIRRADDLLREGNLTAFLPKEVKKMMNTIALNKDNKVPFNVDTIDTLKTVLATEQRSAKGSAKQALAVVRQALDDTQLQGGASDEAIIAFDNARKATRSLKVWEESAPALKAISEGVEPDAFMDKFIIGKGATYKDVSKLVDEVKADPNAFGALKAQVAAWIRHQGAPHMEGQPSNLMNRRYNRALEKIGDRKLSLFFGPDEMEDLKATGRVLFYEQYQPSGSAINNSNTATTLTGGILNYIGDRSPTARALNTAFRGLDASINNAGRARQMINPPLMLPNPPGQKGALAAPLSLGILNQ